MSPLIASLLAHPHASRARARSHDFSGRSASDRRRAPSVRAARSADRPPVAPEPPPRSRRLPHARCCVLALAPVALKRHVVLERRRAQEALQPAASQLATRPHLQGPSRSLSLDSSSALHGAHCASLLPRRRTARSRFPRCRMASTSIRPTRGRCVRQPAQPQRSHPVAEPSSRPAGLFASRQGRQCSARLRLAEPRRCG